MAARGVSGVALSLSARGLPSTARALAPACASVACCGPCAGPGLGHALPPACLRDGGVAGIPAGGRPRAFTAMAARAAGAPFAAGGVLGLGGGRAGPGQRNARPAALMQQTRNNWLEPKKLKYRKMFKMFPKGQVQNMELLSFGKYGLQTLETGRLKSNVLEGVRRVMVRTFARKGQIWPRVNCDHPVTRKPLEVRMGKGKGSVDHYVARCKKGQILFEVDGVPHEEMVQAFEEIKSRMPLKIRLIQRDGWAQG